MTFEQRLANGQITVVESGPDRIWNKRFGWTNGEYRILSDGRRQWRQLRDDGSVSYAWKWQDSKR